MSESEKPLQPNPTSGGTPAEPPAEEAEVGDVEGVATMMENVNIARGDGTKQDTSPKTPSFSFQFNPESNNDEEDEDEDDDDDDDDEEGEDDDEDPPINFPPVVKRRVERLRKLNKDREEIMEGYLKERAALESKYSNLCKPLYEQRKTIVAGKLDDEIEDEAKAEKAKKDSEKDGEEEEEEEEDDENIVGIPQFWVCAMSHVETVAEIITEQDVDCLEYLHDITCEENEDGKGFILRFHFRPNDYFTNDVLVKRYEVPNLLLDDEPILKNVTGCDIHWKPGRSLTYRTITKKQRSRSGKRAGQIRTVTKQERIDSFFHFFNPPKIPSMAEMDEEEADAIEEAFDRDYDVAQAFRSHVIPRAVLWFTGDALDDDVMILGEGDEWPDYVVRDEQKDDDDGNEPNGDNPGGENDPECKQS